MLYDILFIDDDFDNDFDNENSNIGKFNAQKLFLELVRANLRVTYTTGELDDLKKLGSKDLSCIKYIFCDLRLLGIDDTKGESKDITSKLVGIFRHLKTSIKSEEITVFINSKYPGDWNSLERGLSAGVGKRYKFKLLKEKNNLPDKDKYRLLNENFNLHIKSFIINAAIEVERIFDDMLKAINSTDATTFDNKRKKLISEFKLDLVRKKQILDLQKTRNKLAHTDNNLGSIEDINIRKTPQKKPKNSPIKFKNFDDLTKYLEHIEQLKKYLKSAPSINQ